MSTGLVAVRAAPAAASGFTVRLAPESNPFLFVDVSGASTYSGAAIIQWPLNGGSNQVWTLRPAGSDFEIVNRGSGSQGAHLDAWYWNGGHNQYFVASNV